MSPGIIPAFLRQNARWLSACGLLMLGSSFGQTFFISLFAGDIRAEFGLSHGAWGGYYTAGTLGSALLMLYAGGLTDRYRVRAVAQVILVLFALACLAMASVAAAWMLIPVIFLLRFCGQGMMSHTASVALARWFARSRGRANAIMTIGFLIGESSFPFLFVLFTGLAGWRVSWVLAAGLTLLLIPVFRSLLKVERQPGSEAEAITQVGLQGRHWTRRDALGHWFFWAVAMGVVAPSTFGTAFFFQQVHFTEIKGWSLATFVALIPLYSMSAFGSLFAFGAIADRWGSGVVLSVAMLPGAVAFWLFASAQDLATTALGMVVFGMMTGAMGTVGGAFWPEFYGTRSIGSVRSVATSLMVLGSAIGPGLTGVLIDLGVGYERQMYGMSVYFMVLTVILAVSFQIVRPSLPAREM